MKVIRVKLYRLTNTKWNNEKKRHEKTDPYLYECLGSDNWFKLDARLSLYNLIEQAKKKIDRLKLIKNIDTFEIVEGYSERISELDEKGKIIAKVNLEK